MYNNKSGKGLAIFFAPDDGGGSGGSSGTSGQAPNNSGQQSAPATQEAIIDPKLFDQIPMDELDDDTRKVIDKIKNAAIATSQQVTTLRSQNEQLGTQARSFQSAADRANAELQKLAPKQPTQAEDDPIVTIVQKNLRANGYSENEVKGLTPTFVGMFRDLGAFQKEALGKDLQPLVGTVLGNQATTAFQEAQANDPLEMLKIPEVAQATWNAIKDRATQGKETNADIVLNFAKMFWADHALKTKQGGTQSQPQHQTSSGTMPINTGMGFPLVGGITSIAPTPANPNAPRTQMNEDTKEAVATSLRAMTVGMKIKLPGEFAGMENGSRRRR